MKQLGWYEYRFRKYDGQWATYTSTRLLYREVEEKDKKTYYDFDEFYESDVEDFFFYRGQLPLFHTRYIESPFGEMMFKKKYPTIYLIKRWHKSMMPTMEQIVKELSVDEFAEYCQDHEIIIPHK